MKKSIIKNGLTVLITWSCLFWFYKSPNIVNCFIIGLLAALGIDYIIKSLFSILEIRKLNNGRN